MGKKRMKLRRFMVILLSAALIGNVVNWQDLAAYAEEDLLRQGTVSGSDLAAPEEAVSGSDLAALEEAVPGSDLAVPGETVSGPDLAVSEGTVSGSDLVALEEAVSGPDLAVSEGTVSGSDLAVPGETVSGPDLAVSEGTVSGSDLAVPGETVSGPEDGLTPGQNDPGGEKGYVPLYSETVDLGSTVTSGETWEPGMAFSADTIYPTLFNAGGGAVIGETGVKEERADNWIDRLDIPDYGRRLYDVLAEGSDNDGTDDCLIDDAYFSATGEHAVEVNYGDGRRDVFNGICVLDIEYGASPPSSSDLRKISVTMRAAFDAFDRDYPEVFWLTGATQAKYLTSGKRNSDGTDTYRLQAYLTLKSHVDASGNPLFDARSGNYRNAASIKAGIETVNTRVDAIRSEEPTDVVGKIRWYNKWLTENNEYNTGDLNNGPDDMRECINALTGKEGTAGPVCESYARAFKVLCDRAGIPCVLVDGKATPPGTSISEEHMWNYVQVDSEWYAVDVTWNDPVVSGKSGKLSGAESEDWFLVGANTVIPGGSGVIFLVSHPPVNCASEGGFRFLNGPVLCLTEYKIPKLVSLSGNADLVYGYTGVPGIEVGNGTAGSYRWYRKNDALPSEVAGAVSAIFPAGQVPGTYFCRVTFSDGEAVDGPEVTVAPKRISVELTGTVVKDYDGTTVIPAGTGNVLALTLSGVEDADSGGVDAEEGDYAFADENAGGSKRVIASGIKLSGERAFCYLLASDTVSAGVGTILQKDISDAETVVEIEGSDSLTYNGEAQTIRVSLVTADGLTVPAEDYTVAGNQAADVGNYTYKVQIINSDSNFKGAVIRSYRINYLADSVTMLYNGEGTVKPWYTGPVAVTADGYVLSDAVDGIFTEEYQLSGEGANPPVTLYFKNSAGFITAGMDTQIVRIDSREPVFTGGKGIRIESGMWNKLLKTVTFGLFYRETKTVTITAEEEGSGVADYYYYADNSGSTSALTSAELDAVSFVRLGSGRNTFDISDEKKYVIYAYATDVAGNRSSYISTDGIVLDKSAPGLSVQADGGKLADVTAVIRFSVDEEAEVSYQYYKNGEEAPGDWIAYPGKGDYVAKGEYSIRLSGLQQNTLYIFSIRASDRAGNGSKPKSISFSTKQAVPEFAESPVIAGVYGQKVEDMALKNEPASINGVPGVWQIAAGQTDVPGVGTTKVYDVVFIPENTDLYCRVLRQVRPEISPKQISVVIDSKEREYGEDNPPLTFRCNTDELVGADRADDLEITLTTEARRESAPGDYEITGVSGSVNYDVLFTAGILRITEVADKPKLPFITDEDGAEGWDAIASRLEAIDEGRVNVDMQGASEVPGSVFDALRGKDVTIFFEMGSDIWSVNGKSISGGSHAAVDLGVAWDRGSIPAAVVSALADGSLAHMTLALAGNKMFGFEAKLAAMVDGGLDYTGKRANLFGYNPADGSMGFVCDAEIRADGRAELAIDRALDYVVVIADTSMKPAGSGGTAPPTGAGEETSPAGSEGTAPPTGAGEEASPAGSGGTAPPEWTAIESTTDTRKPINFNEQAPKTGEEDSEQQMFLILVLILVCMAAAGLFRTKKYRM